MSSKQFNGIDQLTPGFYWFFEANKVPVIVEKREGEAFVRFTSGGRQSWVRESDRFEGPLQVPGLSQSDEQASADAEAQRQALKEVGEVLVGLNGYSAFDVSGQECDDLFVDMKLRAQRLVRSGGVFAEVQYNIAEEQMSALRELGYEVRPLDGADSGYVWALAQSEHAGRLYHSAQEAWMMALEHARVGCGRDVPALWLRELAEVEEKDLSPAQR